MAKWFYKEYSLIADFLRWSNFKQSKAKFIRF